MIAEDNVREVGTFEEYTLFSLDQSLDGLHAMTREARYCGDALRKGAPEIPKIKALAEHLHQFNMFENNVSAVFGVDRAACADAQGSFESAMTAYRKGLEDFGNSLERGDVAEAGRVLAEEIAASLARIGTLLPSVRDSIAREYGDTSAAEASAKIRS